MNDCYQDCTNTGNTTTTQGIPHLFDIDNVFDYVVFPIEPNTTDLHIATYTNGTAYFVYTGEEWILDNYKDQQVFPECMPPCEHFHTLSDIIGLSNYLDTLDGTLTSFLDTLADLQDQVDTIIVPSYTHPNHTGDVTSVGDGPTTIVDGAVTTAKIATTGVTAGSYVNANINVNNKGQIVSATNGLQPIKSDWNAVSGLAEILNKPTIPPVYVHPNHTGDVTSTGDGVTVIANNAVTTAKILNDNVTTAKIADLNVTSDKLATSGVTAGVYTSPNLTINNKGIVTAATSIILPLELEVLVVAGGGGGQNAGNGAGVVSSGGGGGVTRASYLCPLQQNFKIPIVVGNGGSSSGGTGGASYFLTSSVIAATGGQGNGNAGHYSASPSLITPGIIYSTYNSLNVAGGGATAAGPIGGAALGGAGLTINFSGSSTTYGRGGAGGRDVTTTSNAAANTGNGGKGAVNDGTPGIEPGGTGGSGIVIVRYLSPTAKFSGGTITTFGSYQVHTFLTSGELTTL